MHVLHGSGSSRPTRVGGGEHRHPESDLKPNWQTSNRPAVDGRTTLALGQTIEVQIRVFAEDWAGDAFMIAEAVELYEGKKLVATGEFLDIQESQGI